MGHMKKYSQFLKELPTQSIVVCYSEFQPPTVVHEQLIKTAKKISESTNSKLVVYTSKKQDKKNPLSEEKKVKYVELLFPNTKVETTELSQTQLVKSLSEQYKKVTFVTFSDSSTETISKIASVVKINESEAEHNNMLNKVRSYATKGMLTEFKQQLPGFIREIDSKRIMNDVRIGMGLDPVKEQIVLVKDQIREQYFRGEIYNVGDIVESSGVKYEIVKRGSNHLLLKEENGKLVSKWIQDVTLVEDSSVGYAPKELSFGGYTTKKLHHSEDAVRAFTDTIQRYGDKYPAKVLDALMATDTYMGLSDLHLAQGIPPTETEKAQWIKAHDHAKQHLEELGEFLHHRDYWDNHMHEMEDMLSNYKEEGKSEMSEELEEAIKLGTKVKIHAPGKSYHGQVGHVGEIRNGAYKGAPKTYTVDYGDRNSIQLDKKNVKLHKEVNEELTDKTIKPTDKIKVARIIATMLGDDKAESSSNPEMLINNALRKVRAKALNPEALRILDKMLNLATETGIQYDATLKPSKLKETTEVDKDSEYNIAGDTLRYSDYRKLSDMTRSKPGHSLAASDETNRKMKIKHQLGEGRGPLSDIPNTDRTDKKGIAYNPHRKEKTADDLKRIAAAKEREKKETGLYKKQSPAQRKNTVKSLMDLVKNIGEETIEENYTVHVDDGSKYGDQPHDKDVDHVMSGVKKHNGAFDGHSDKGAYFKFKTHSDAKNFVDHVKKAPHKSVYADLHEETELEESMVDSWKKVQSMDKGSITGGKEDAKKRLAYLKAVHDHHKKFGNDTKKVKAEIENINRSGLAEEIDEAVKEPTGGLKDACWAGYTAVGMKMKNGKKVPNCVPKEEAVKTPVEDDDEQIGAHNSKGFDAFFEEDDKEDDYLEDISDDELDKIADEVQDIEHIIDAYDDEELSVVDDETGEEVEGEEPVKEEALMEVLSRMERMRAKMRLARTKAKRERALKIAVKRYSSSKVINKRSRRLAIKLMKKRLLRGRDMTKLSVGEKERIERMIEKRKPIINRLAMKLAPRVRKIEKSRMSHSKFTQGSQNVAF